jgi:hypothetical protein
MQTSPHGLGGPQATRGVAVEVDFRAGQVDDADGLAHVTGPRWRRACHPVVLVAPARMGTSVVICRNQLLTNVLAVSSIIEVAYGSSEGGSTSRKGS